MIVPTRIHTPNDAHYQLFNMINSGTLLPVQHGREVQSGVIWCSFQSWVGTILSMDWTGDQQCTVVLVMVIYSITKTTLPFAACLWYSSWDWNTCTTEAGNIT